MHFWTKKTHGDMKMAHDLKVMHETCIIWESRRVIDTVTNKETGETITAEQYERLNFVAQPHYRVTFKTINVKVSCRLSPRDRHKLAMKTTRNTP